MAMSNELVTMRLSDVTSPMIQHGKWYAVRVNGMEELATVLEVSVKKHVQHSLFTFRSKGHPTCNEKLLNTGGCPFMNDFMLLMITKLCAAGGPDVFNKDNEVDTKIRYHPSRKTTLMHFHWNMMCFSMVKTSRSEKS